MNKYYTRACNFFYGKESKKYIEKRKSIPLNGISQISFDKIQIIDRKGVKTIDIKDIITNDVNIYPEQLMRILH